MLSVSGAIEAVRVGEEGRGFAVVSNDIRRWRASPAAAPNGSRTSCATCSVKPARCEPTSAQSSVAAEVEAARSRAIEDGSPPSNATWSEIVAGAAEISAGRGNDADGEPRDRAGHAADRRGGGGGGAFRRAIGRRRAASRRKPPRPWRASSRKSRCWRRNCRRGVAMTALVFRVGGRRLALDAAAVAGVTRRPALDTGSARPAALIGVAALGGRATPVIALSARARAVFCCG